MIVCESHDPSDYLDPRPRRPGDAAVEGYGDWQTTTSNPELSWK